MNTNEGFKIAGKIEEHVIRIINMETKKKYYLCIEEDEQGQIYNVYLEYMDKTEKVIYLSEKFDPEVDKDKENLRELLARTTKTAIDILVDIILGNELVFSDEIRLSNYRFY